MTVGVKAGFEWREYQTESLTATMVAFQPRYLTTRVSLSPESRSLTAICNVHKSVTISLTGRCAKSAVQHI